MTFIILNAILISIAIYLFTKKDLLSYYKSGMLWLSWLAIGVITLMDELTSIYYAPSEAYRYIGVTAIIFLPLTSLFIRYLSTRMIKIAEILERHKMKGGGVYNFSYLVLGPFISFVAVASILITYVLTAAISAVSAVENVASIAFEMRWHIKLIAELTIIWLVAGLNILGIRENARVVFIIFLMTAVVLLNLLTAGIIDFDVGNLERIKEGFKQTTEGFTGGGFVGGYSFMVASVSNCILAYAGVESVLQVARISESWHNIKKAYIFLALTVGIFTPCISVLVLSNPRIDFAAHETDLITHFGIMMGGEWFGILVAIIASLCLIMAINTSCVAGSELVERVANRYGFHWLNETNKRASLYRIHIGIAIFFSLIIIATQGQQMALAAMYAVGLVATFVINLGALLIYNYQKGTEQKHEFHIKMAGTIFLFIIVFSCFIYLIMHKPLGFALWGGATAICLLLGFLGTRKRAPETKQIAKGETPFEMILYIAEQEGENIHIYFRRFQETRLAKGYDITTKVTLFSPRQKIPPKLGDNHFRIPFNRGNIFYKIEAILELIAYELPHKNITVHFGWPMSSWIDRFSTGIMVMKITKLPQRFPQMNFKIEKFKEEPKK
ncbi:MAG: APC family permease [bacterium]|nr:APC family permease [bacterium]MBU1918085.1 APC family permease [bacterium]